jgi:hypothetical protein
MENQTSLPNQNQNQQTDAESNIAKSIIEMISSVDEGDRNLGSAVFDTLLDDKQELDQFMLGFDKVNDEKKSEVLNELLTSNYDPNNIPINKDYLKICIEHTKWKIRYKQI